jgi:stage II sporulation protein E
MLGYDWMLLLMEFSLAAIGVLIFYQAGCALRLGPKGAEEGLEQSLSLVVTCALALISISGLFVGPFNLLAVAACWLVLMASFAGGSGAGACTGIVAGILAGYGHVYPAVVVATLAMAGLLAGLFNIWGRGGTFGGFAAGIIAMLIYGGYPTVTLGLADLSIAGLLFILTPIAIREKARRLLVNQGNEWVWEYQQRLRRTTVTKLQRLAMIFSRLSNSFMNRGRVEDMAGNHLQMSQMFEQLACTVCTGCVNYRRCWERELYSTYSQLMDYLTAVQEVSGAGFDGLLSRRCHNIEQLLAQAGSLYRQFSSERRWALKVYECKDVVSEQLRGVSDVIGQLARQIRLDVNCRQDLEEELASRLSGWGVEVFDLSVKGTERNLPQVHIRAKVPAGENPLGVMQAMVSDVVGQSLQLVENSPVGGASRLIFALPIKFKLELGVAQAAKGEVNGDCFCHLQTAACKHVYMLSDGMGKGKGARVESNQALLLARDMLEAGFSAETAIKALNSLLVLRGNERFATLDIAVIDSALGKMEVFKTGAATSFIKAGGEVELISGAGLPIGIVQGVEPRMITRNLTAGEYLVMVSDGVIDGQDRDEGWLVNQLKTMGNLAAPAMARQLLNRATKVGRLVRDDSTVMVVRVREAKNEAYWDRYAV